MVNKLLREQAPFFKPMVARIRWISNTSEAIGSRVLEAPKCYWNVPLDAARRWRDEGRCIIINYDKRIMDGERARATLENLHSLEAFHCRICERHGVIFLCNDLHGLQEHVKTHDRDRQGRKHPKPKTARDRELAKRREWRRKLLAEKPSSFKVSTEEVRAEMKLIKGAFGKWRGVEARAGWKPNKRSSLND